MSRLDDIRKDSRTRTRRAQKRANKQVSRTRKRLVPVARDVKGGAGSATDTAVDWAAPKVEAAKDWAAPKAEAAAEWAAPKAEAARDWATPKVESAFDKVVDEVLPKVADAVAGVLAATEPAREEAKLRGTAAVAALKGEVPPPRSKKSTIGRLLFFLGAAVAAVVGWNAWNKSRSRGAHSSSPWAAAPAPPTAMGSSPATPTVTDLTGADAAAGTDLTGSDAAAASPDEALADAADEESTSTTTRGASTS